MTFSLTSPAFRDGDQIPAKYAGDGENVSPPLEWSDAPAGTKSFALVVEDPDAPSGTFHHWGLYNIMGERSILPEAVGHGAKTEKLGKGVNDFGEPRYGGPAPPKGHGTHHYHFKLAALDVEELSRVPKMSIDDIWKAAEKHMLAQAELVGTYSR
ncbi:MAG: YbhB/YbcL family Raf kinase inhibitor-like protein [Bradyrhizobium sp.]|uniref:YbhB/YbcL family Raf kinase inhibitor-like protein n=1 Tax=Bradyrhizobium sp. TaxID=376 RepID=UPI001C28A2FE|nr:YbhB/YbcL family Raf kinase inhibitor-like protein [Bradyrhizobium sp.]MBU6463399.1 YbhB/YbcL family Raf kinase inhibitor-like protein [Pseudomonadota bacterium]MDE2067456.1 YbhB/YbcL family Raf kinase inhibitor-like protein [Bradyrhizobium sp.]MDE2241656.1 YbhB/YbcL family Raf kinase inhibitor-like protein [Bradyrhizobium sp.]